MLVTGHTGFAGSHLFTRLGSDGHEAWGLSLENGDVTDQTIVARAVKRTEPAVVFHLAAQAIPSIASLDPLATIRTNVLGTAIVMGLSPEAKVVVASSADVYGSPNLPLVNEETPPRPLNAYAASKLAAEAFCGRAVILRPSNQIGPRQREELVASAFARQIARIEAGECEPILFHGDLSAKRDFLDVRDMADAYVRAASLPAGLYVVGSGVATSIAEILDLLLGMARVPIRSELDPARGRPGHAPAFAIDASRFRAATGWEPKTPLDTSLRDLLDHWRGHFSKRPVPAYGQDDGVLSPDSVA